jgi:transcriptional regulator with XRE-family HTH domain
MKIGNRIKNLRTSQRITLKELAKTTGLTTSFLSQLERDLTSPSVSSLEKIAQALNTKVGNFFEKEERKELVFIKKGMGKKSIDKEKNIASESLASGFLNIKMQPFVFALGSGAELTKELIYPQGEKFGMVLKGKVELWYDSEKLTLEEGDSIYCAFTQKLQRIVNIGEDETRLLLVVFLPA